MSISLPLNPITAFENEVRDLQFELFVTGSASHLEIERYNTLQERIEKDLHTLTVPPLSNLDPAALHDTWVKLRVISLFLDVHYATLRGQIPSDAMEAMAQFIVANGDIPERN